MKQPHGGQLVNRVANEIHTEQLRAKIQQDRVIRLTRPELQDLINITTGRFSPLTGFMSEDDFWKVMHDMTLEDGTIWSLPDYARYRLHSS